MKAEIKNTSRAPQGVHCVDGLKHIEPGQTRTLDVAETYMPRVDALPFLDVKWLEEAKPTKSEPDDLDTTGPNTAAEVLAMFADKAVHFQTAKAEAAKLLGNDMPEKKADIIAALEELATKPE